MTPTPMEDVINTGLRNADTEDLVEELNSRFYKVGVSDIKFRMDRQVEHEAMTSASSVDEIKSELAKHWLEV